jgi:DNA-directed RNA polymerase specialized sigma24 family protein
MSDTRGPFQLLLQQARQGQPRAWLILVRSYDPPLLAALRRHLQHLPSIGRLRDAEDVDQEVWLVFFEQTLNTKHFDTSAALIAHLLRVGYNQVRNLVWRYLRAGKCNLTRDRSLAAAEGCVSSAPGPERVAAAKEQWQQLLAQPSEAHRRVVELRGLGWTIPAIAEEVGLSGSSVNRILARARAGL